MLSPSLICGLKSCNPPQLILTERPLMCNTSSQKSGPKEAETSASAKMTWLSELPQALSTGAFLPVTCIKEKVRLAFASLLTTGYLGLAFWWLPYFLPLICFFFLNVLATLPFPALWPSFLLMQKWSFEKFKFPQIAQLRVAGLGPMHSVQSLLMYCWQSSLQPKFLTSCLLLALSKPFNFVLSGGFYLWVRTWLPWKLAR